jgi:hypothetical protein
MFLAQALNTDRSCQRAVNDAAVKRWSGGLPQCSTHTGGYCHARQRLPMEMVSTLTQHTGQLIAARTPVTWHWRGRPVRLVSGTTVTMPDTPANQITYPQPRSQKPGLGFPICRLVGILCLGSGAVLNAAIGAYRGKGGDEQTLLRSILTMLDSGDVLWAMPISPPTFCSANYKQKVSMQSSNNTAHANVQHNQWGQTRLILLYDCY